MPKPTRLLQVVDLRAVPAEKRRTVLSQLAGNFATRFVEECASADDEERARCSNTELCDEGRVHTVELDGSSVRLAMDELWCDPQFDMEGKLHSVAVYYRGNCCGKPFRIIPQSQKANSEKKVKVFIDTGRGGKQAFWVPASAA